jgi:xeroderma pigmentosum group C-complementing protein
MPSHMSGFKDHPMYVNTLESADSRYVLERHLKREEVIQPKREIGRFRGEPVYRRQNVLSCKTAENWMRIGRKVKDRQETEGCHYPKKKSSGIGNARKWREYTAGVVCPTSD